MSIIINPIYGDTYSFPWKRGPHDNLNEYLEALNTFDMVRNTTYQCLSDFDYMGKLAVIYNSEDESQYVVTKVATLRVVTQILRLKKEITDTASEMLIGNQQMMYTIN